MIGVYDRPALRRGDTLSPFRIRVETKDGEPIIPASVCCQLRTERNKLAATFTTAIDVSTGYVTISGLHATQTRQLKPGNYLFDVEYTSAEGKVKTYLEGAMEVIQDISQC